MKTELSDPVKLQKHLFHLEKLILEKSELKTLRFPHEILCERIDEITLRENDKLGKLNDPIEQREFILRHLLPGFLSKGFLSNTEKKLTSFLDQSDANVADLKAVGAGLLFLELHKRRPDFTSQNPLWDIIFKVSYDEIPPAKETAAQSASAPSLEPLQLPRPAIESDDSSNLTESQLKSFHKAINLLENGSIELGFSLDTILQGLRAYRSQDTNSTSDVRIGVLKSAYEREIREREREDLIWGLEFAMSQADETKKREFQIVLDAVDLLPCRDNPVIFALYYKCITQFYRYLKEDELEMAKAILQAPNESAPLIEYGRILLLKESPRRAIKAFEAALAINPLQASVEFGLGIALWMDESFREARLYFDKVIRHVPSGNPLTRLVALFKDLQNGEELPKDAIDYFKHPIIS